jgi:phage shock protein C
MALYKNKNDKLLFGVCSGIAKHLGLNPLIVRLAFIFGFFITGSLLLWIYLILALVLPWEINL